MTAKIPLQIVELRQPRCALRFGTAPCIATGTPKCYNTWGSCPSAATRVHYDATGSIWWRFVANRPGNYLFGDYSDPDNIRTHGIPVSGLSISTTKSELNVSGILDGKSPFGIHASCSVSMDDFVFNDVWGDHYLADRVNMPTRPFWAPWLARNRLFGGMELVIYTGYEGDALAAMSQQLYIFEGVDGPSGGKVTLRGVDPLRLADSKRSLFPPAYTMSLKTDITAADTSLTVITDAENNISGIIGLTTQRHVLIGSEVIGYSGYTVVTAGEYLLTGLTRAMGGTTAAAASAGDKIGRVGHFEDAILADCAEYLLSDWTPVGAARIDTATWHYERDHYLSTSRCNTFITSLTAADVLCGELCQQGTFNIWWDERAQLVKMQAVRPPEGTPVALTDATAILADSASMTMEPDSRLTRVLVYYDQIDVTKTGASNYRVVTGQIEADGEAEAAGGEPRTLQIFARWVQTEAQAYQVISRTLLRYRDVPRFATIKVSAKDMAISAGDTVDVTTRTVIDSEGRSKTVRWQVISWAEVKAGETYLLDLQDFTLVGRFGSWMAPGADYAGSTTDEHDTGAFWADSAGLMPDGSDGYQWS